MKKTILMSALMLLTAVSLAFAETTDEKQLKDLAQQALSKLETVKAIPFQRTTDPDAQWFPEAAFGFFVHWGIHSVAGLQPSWAMLEGYPYGSDRQEYWGKGYYTLLKKFNPQHYDPDKWMEAAAKAGMTYAVITTKHHDGYALWPSNYGNMSTKQYMKGRDLLRPYVDACHKYGLKVGFYYSPPDWAKQWLGDKSMGGYEYNVGQLSELLTRYGKIDILWFDGGIENPEKVIAWVRLLQPHILINDRSGGGGDFATPECFTPDQAPDGWWEECNVWSGHWGYAPDSPVNNNSWVMEKLVKNRSWGGNFLLSGVGPRPDGTLRPQIYERMAKLAEWMAHSRESLIGAEPVDKYWAKFSNVPLTRRDGVWYLHILEDQKCPAEIIGVPRPKSVMLLRTKTPLEYTYQGRTISVTVPDSFRTKVTDRFNDVVDDVIAIYWDKEPW